MISFLVEQYIFRIIEISLSSLILYFLRNQILPSQQQQPSKQPQLPIKPSSTTGSRLSDNNNKNEQTPLLVEK